MAARLKDMPDGNNSLADHCIAEAPTFLGDVLCCYIDARPMAGRQAELPSGFSFADFLAAAVLTRMAAAALTRL